MWNLRVGIALDGHGDTVDVDCGCEITGNGGWEAVRGYIVEIEILVARVSDEFAVAVRGWNDAIEDCTPVALRLGRLIISLENR